MKRTVFTGALALASALAIVGPARADDNSNSDVAKQNSQNQEANADRDQKQNREHRDARAKNRDNDRDRARNENARGERRDRRSNSMQPGDNQRSASQRGADEAADFLAGYYAGYAEGYCDGNDDSIYYIIDLHRQKQREQQAGQSGASSGANASSQADKNRSDEARERGDRDKLSSHRQRAREAARRGHPASSTNSDQSRLLDGRVIESWTARQGQRQHTLARVRDEAGDSVLVDLGPAKNLRDVRIEEGDDIAVRGSRDDDGRRFVARQAWINDGPTLQIAAGDQDQKNSDSGSDSNSSANREESREHDSRR